MSANACPDCQAPLPHDAPMGLCPTCLFGISPPATPALPSEIGDYELLDKGRKGGMGIVYRARQRSLNRVVALKMLRLPRPATVSDLQRFRIEAEACAALRHENIVEIYEADEYQGQPYFSMAYIEGRDLGKELESREPFP